MLGDPVCLYVTCPNLSSGIPRGIEDRLLQPLTYYYYYQFLQRRVAAQKAKKPVQGGSDEKL